MKFQRAFNGQEYIRESDLVGAAKSCNVAEANGTTTKVVTE